MDIILETASSETPAARWYVIHTYSGFENRVEQTVKEMIRTGQAKDLIEDIIVPTEKVVELVKGQKRTSTRKFYPGYVLIKMIFNDESWHMIQSIPKVTGFIGGKNRPTPLSETEANQIISTIQIRKEDPRPKFHFERGDEVRVIDGPFSNFNAVVEDVNYDKGKLKVSVSIFGRQTPVELDFVQVSKA
ncbi:MAG: transcription termination/antitermination protein NusG [Deltaproteobacteria bacterium]|nr:transcription termination/antitermination protein NusG [Deltaproteobacteria bacterium]